jgi:hypothetical protein
MDSTFIIAYTRYPLPYEFKQDTYAFTIEDIPLGSSPSDIAPATLQCYAGKEGETPEEFIIPIIWDDAGEYDKWKNGEQTISGRLDISGYPELAGASLPTVTATITLTGGDRSEGCLC